MGLLAKATVIREQWEQEQKLAEEQRLAAEQAALAAAVKMQPNMVQSVIEHAVTGVKTAKTKLTHLATDFKAQVKTAIKKSYHVQLRRYAAMIFAVGLSFQSAAPRNIDTHSLALQQINNWNKVTPIEVTVQSQPENADINSFVDIFTKDIHKTQISEKDRNNLARLLYGEAGSSTADAIEVLHTVLNRVSSPLFKGTINDIITAKNQYIGYKAENPVEPRLREIVDFVVDEWEANGCKAIDDCDHYYFVTGIPNVCNKFEISAKDSQGAWVPNAKKQYAALQQYCPTATDQATRFNRMYEIKHATHAHVAHAYEATHTL